MKFVAKVVYHWKKHGFKSLMYSIYRHISTRGKRIYPEHIVPAFIQWAEREIDDVQVSFTTSANRAGYDWRDDFESERAVLNDFKSRINSSDIVYDIGSNVGIYSAVASSIGASVHAFEPDPDTADLLRLNLEQNGGGTVHTIALGSERTTSSLEQRGLTGHTLSEEGGITVPVYRGDCMVEEINEPPTVVKIDVEGGESDVIDGLDKALERHARLVYCELHTDRSDGRCHDVKSKLRSLGFEVVELQRRSEQIHIRAQ